MLFVALYVTLKIKSWKPFFVYGCLNQKEVLGALVN